MRQARPLFNLKSTTGRSHVHGLQLTAELASAATGMDPGSRLAVRPCLRVFMDLDSIPAVRTLPVLVENAQLPRSEDLLESIRRIVRINAIELIPCATRGF